MNFYKLTGNPKRLPTAANCYLYRQPKTMKSNTLLGALFTTAAAIALLASPPATLSPAETRVAALAMLTIGFWATGILPEHITSLLFFVLAMLFSVAAPATVFSGFTSTAVWLIFGGLVIGVAIMKTGLGQRVAARAASRLDGSYARIITGLVAAGVLFSFLMPSAMGRVVLLTPIAEAIAGHFGFKRGSRGRTGVILATILGSFIPAFGILPANVPNMVLVGMAGTQYQVSLLYGSYLLLHFPVLGLVKAALIVALILWFYPDAPGKVPHTELTLSGDVTRDERILSWSLFIMLGLWMTDFLHHVSPAWIALAGAVFLMLPGIAIIGRQQFNQKINWASLVFVAGILGLGAMINQSGLGDTLARKLINVLPLDTRQPFLSYLSVSLASTVTGVATTLPGVPAVFTPLSEGIAQATGLPVRTVLMMQVLGFSTPLFPYQAPPIIIGMQLSGERIADAGRICILLALITIFLLLPLNYLWWQILGWL